MSHHLDSPGPFELPIVSNKKQPNRASQEPKRGRGRIRAAVLILVHLVIAAHIAHYIHYGWSLSPVEPSEAMYTIELGWVNAGAIFFGLTILSTVIFGRFFCGWGCHLVALQDLSGYLLKKIGLRPKPLRSRLLVYIPFAVAFAMFFWETVKRLWRGVPHPGFVNHLWTENFWYTFPGPVVSGITFLVCGGVIVYLLGNKGFCTYGCPYGAFFSVADRMALGRIRVTDACHQCGQCTAHCTSNVQVHAEVRDFGMVVDPGCMKCMDCVSVCPNEALYFGLFERPGARASRSSLPVIDLTANRKAYDFTIAEELFGLVVVGITVFAVRALYDIAPLLLSVAIGAMTGYLAIQFIRVFRRADLRIQNLQLKRSGRITPTGKIALGLLSLWFVFVLHSAVVQYHRYQGREHLRRVSSTWGDLFLGMIQPRLTPQDHAHLAQALHNFEVSDRIGIADVKEVKLGLAVCHMMKNDFNTGENYLREAIACDPQVRELYREYLLARDRAAEAAELH